MTLKEQSEINYAKIQAHFFNLEADHAKGAYIYAKNKKAYLDFSGGVAVTATGHCHPKVVKAIQDQAEKLIHSCFAVAYSDPPVQLADKLIACTNNELNSVYFCQSGTESVEAALKCAKYVTKKSKIIAFKGGFHGRSMGALSVTSSKDKYREGFGPLVPGVSFYPYPYTYRCDQEHSPETCPETYIQRLQDYFETQSDDIAAVIVEPILGEGGYVPAPYEWLKTVRQLCDQKKILLIMDEIQTGCGRTGAWFAYQQAGVCPDLMTLAKGIASGMPLGALMGKKEIMDQWLPGSHGGTYNGNPVTCAAGLATVTVIEPELESIQKKGKKALEKLNKGLKESPIVGDIRGIGLMIGIEFVKDRQTKEPHPTIIKQIMDTCFENQLLIISCGVHDNVIRICPPLIISQEDLDKGLDIVINIINAIH